MGLSQSCEIKLKNKFQRGNRNLITDIPGVRVGQVTLQNAEKAVHTGVTVILPHGGNLFKEKVPAGVSIINGFGKSAGLIQVQELETIETPIVMTNTFGVGTALNALTKYMLEENEDIALGDVIPDKAAEQAIESSFERVYTQQLHDVLESCLDTLKPQEADTIRGRFYRGEKLKEIADRQGCTFQYIRVQESNALRGLRRGANLRKLKAWREDIIDRNAYKTGFGMFRQMGASSVEITVERLNGIPYYGERDG